MTESESKPQEQTVVPAVAPKQNDSNPPSQQGEKRQQQGRPCPKDCSKCSMPHQIYCTAKMTFDSFAVMNVIIQRLDIQSQRIADLEQRIAAIQSTEAEFAAPLPFQGDLFAGTE